MSSKAKQVLLWLMIISSALLFVYFLNGKQTAGPKELSFDKAMTQIKNKEVTEATIRQDTLELVSKTMKNLLPNSIRAIRRATKFTRRRTKPARRLNSNRLRAAGVGFC